MCLRSLKRLELVAWKGGKGRGVRKCRQFGFGKMGNGDVEEYGVVNWFLGVTGIGDSTCQCCV